MVIKLEYIEGGWYCVKKDDAELGRYRGRYGGINAARDVAKTKHGNPNAWQDWSPRRLKSRDVWKMARQWTDMHWFNARNLSGSFRIDGNQAWSYRTVICERRQVGDQWWYYKTKTRHSVTTARHLSSINPERVLVVDFDRFDPDKPDVMARVYADGERLLHARSKLRSRYRINWAEKEIIGMAQNGYLWHCDNGSSAQQKYDALCYVFDCMNQLLNLAITEWHRAAKRDRLKIRKEYRIYDTIEAVNRDLEGAS